jgi:hypothetical protein
VIAGVVVYGAATWIVNRPGVEEIRDVWARRRRREVAPADARWDGE